MGRPDSPTVSFIDKCVENERNTYKAFKVRPVLFLGVLQIFLMGILFPRKKNGFNPEFEDFFKDYEISNRGEYGGYNKKDTIRMAIKKNKKAFEVLYNKHGILIFRKKMNAEMESLIGEDFTSNEMQSPYKGSVPDSDTIEEIYEKIMDELIIPKLKMRITHAADMISISSGYGSSPVSPSSETSSTINSPINLESLSDCNLLSDFRNTMNLTSQDLPPYISLEQVQISSEQSLDQQLLTNNFMPENDYLLDNTSRWCEDLLNSKEKMNELKQPREEARKTDQPEETENDSLLDDISKWCDELLNSKEKMNELKQLHEEAQKTDQSGETENSKADELEQQVISNSSPDFVECGTFDSSSFDNISSVIFSGKSDANILEQSIDNFSEELHPVKEEDNVILDVLNMEDLFQKYTSLTDIPTLKKVQRYPSCVDFSSMHFESLEEIDTSGSDLLNTSQDMDCT